MEKRWFYLKSLLLGTAVCTVVWILLMYYAFASFSLFGSSGNSSDPIAAFFFIVLPALYFVMMFFVWRHGKQKFADRSMKHTLIFAGICLLCIGTGLLGSYLSIWLLETIKK